MRAFFLVGWAVTIGGAAPGLWLAWQWQTGALGFVPDEPLLHWTGRFALTLLVATLALGPLHLLTGWKPVFAMRRPMGLWAFAYAACHLSVWLFLDQSGVWAFILAEITSMLHVQLGLAALLLLLPLALTSTNAALKALTLPRWNALHLLVWPAVLIALVHAWMVARFENPLVLGLGALVLAMLTGRLAAGLRAARR
jgi:sulfoxide reductase heme-binding subunit YedZ